MFDTFEPVNDSSNANQQHRESQRLYRQSLLIEAFRFEDVTGHFRL